MLKKKQNSKSNSNSECASPFVSFCVGAFVPGGKLDSRPATDGFAIPFTFFPKSTKPDIAIALPFLIILCGAKCVLQFIFENYFTGTIAVTVPA